MAKSNQNYDELFGFDKIESSLKKLDTLFLELEKNGIVWLDKLDKKQKETIDSARALQKVLQSIGLNDPKGSQKIAGIGEDITRLAGQTQKYREIANGLNSTLDVNKQSIVNLTGALKIIKTDYEKLDPTQKNFTSEQKRLAEQANAVKAAIAAQSQTMKAANTVLSATTNSYDGLNKKTNELWRQLKTLDNAYDLNTGKLNKNNKAALDLANQITKNRDVLKKMDTDLGVHTRNVGNYGSGWQSAKQDLLAFAGVTTAVDTTLRALSATFEIISDFEKYRSVLTFASENTARLSQNLQFLDVLADKTGTDVEVLYRKFGSFTIAAKSANFTIEGTRKLFKSIIDAGGAYKMSNEAVALSLKAVEQIMNKNKLSMEEISQQLGDHLPGALGLFATGLGVSTQKLTEMIKNGELFAKETLPKFAENLEKVVGTQAQNNVNTIAGGWNRMTNQVKLFIDEFARDAKVQSFFSKLFNNIADAGQKLRMLYQIMAAKSPNPAAQFQDFETMDVNGRADKISVLKKSISDNEKILAGQTSRVFSARQIKDLEKRNEVLKGTLAVYERTNQELIKAEAIKERNQAADKSSITTMEELNKKIEANQTLLENGILKNSKYLQTTEGKAIKATLDSLRKQKESIGVDTGDKNPRKIKEEASDLEKLEKSVTKLSKLLMDDALKDIRKNGIVNLPEKELAKWYEQYAILDKIARTLGVDIPDSIEKTKRNLDRFSKKDALSKIGNVSAITPAIPSFIMPNEEMKTAIGDKLPGINDFTNIMIRQQTERLDLQRQFSSKLRFLKEDEKKELLRILAEIQKAERDGDEEAKKRLKEQYDYKINLARDEEQQKKRLRDEFAQSAINLAQSTNELYSAIQDKKITELEKRRDYEINTVAKTEQQKTYITEKYAKQITEIRRRQAVAEKAMAVFQIGVNTAMAIMKIWAEFPKADFGVATIAMSALAGITGALQIAAVLAKPLPAFKKGTKYAPEGAALVAEEGAELRESRGKYTLYEKPSIVNLEQGDKIFTAQETSRMLANNMLRQEEMNRFQQRQALHGDFRQKLQKPFIINNNGISESSIARGVSQGLKDLVIQQNIYDEGGVRRRVLKTNSAIEYQQKRYSLGS